MAYSEKSSLETNPGLSVEDLPVCSTIADPSLPTAAGATVDSKVSSSASVRQSDRADASNVAGAAATCKSPQKLTKSDVISMFSSVEEAVSSIRAGRFVIVIDDPDRENEGDLVLAAEHASLKKIAFMVRHTSGLICVPMDPRMCDKLSLAPMVDPQQQNDAYGTAFTVSVDANTGISTGISANDRARTIRLLSDPATKPSDLRRPGHVFPLRYTPHGVLSRAGHTEASVDLCVMAGLQPAAVIAEIVCDCGEMMRTQMLRKFAATHGIPIITIDLLKHYLHGKLTETIARGSDKSNAASAMPIVQDQAGGHNWIAFQREFTTPRQ